MNTDPEDLAETIMNNTCSFYEKLFVERVIESTREEGLKKKIFAFANNSAKRISSYKPDSDSNGLPY